jgi:hypothetical protein
MLHVCRRSLRNVLEQDGEAGGHRAPGRSYGSEGVLRLALAATAPGGRQGAEGGSARTLAATTHRQAPRPRGAQRGPPRAARKCGVRFGSNPEHWTKSREFGG